MANFKQISDLDKLWLIDLDGTVIIHNSHLEGEQKFTPGAIDFLQRIPPSHIVVFLTARELKYASITEDFLASADILYHSILYNMPHGERILINDIKPSGLKTAYSINVKRDNGLSNFLLQPFLKCVNSNNT